MSDNKTRVFTIGAIIFALGAMLFGIKMYAEWNGVAAQGTIASIDEQSRTDSTGVTTTYYEATVTFPTEQGGTNNGILTYHENSAEVGDTVKIVYQKTDVSRIHRAQSAWWYFPFAGIIGLGILVIYISAKMMSKR